MKTKIVKLIDFNANVYTELEVDGVIAYKAYFVMFGAPMFGGSWHVSPIDGNPEHKPLGNYLYIDELVRDLRFGAFPFT